MPLWWTTRRRLAGERRNRRFLLRAQIQTKEERVVDTLTNVSNFSIIWFWPETKGYAMGYTPEALLEDIRSLQLKNVHGMGEKGASGLSPRRLGVELLSRIEVGELIKLLTDMRTAGTILILGKRGFHEGIGPLCAIDCPLDETFFMMNEGSGVRWKRQTGLGEECFNRVRIYVVADGLPATLARQGVVRRALQRLS